MKKVISKLISVILVITFTISTMGMPVYAANILGNISTSPIETVVPEKIICNATIDDNFADDSLLVMLKKDANPTFKTMSAADFSEIDAKAVECLNEFSASIVKNIRQITKSDTQTMTMSTNAAPTVSMSDLSDSTGYTAKDLISMEKKFNYIYKIQLEETGKRNVLDAIKELEKRDDVYAVEPNYIFEQSSENTESMEFVGQYVEDLMDLPEAWALAETNPGNAEVLVGVIDSGIQANHPYLAGKIDSLLSKDFTDENNATIDSNGHGTHVASIIASNDTSGSFVKGVCQRAKLVNLRVFNSNSSAQADDIIAAIEYATEKEIRILNFCTNAEDFYNNTAKSSLLIDKIEDYTGLIICAAGNEGIAISEIQSNNFLQYYMASIHSTKIVAVAATDQNDALWGNSNYGEYTVDLAAPGVDIWYDESETDPDKRYQGGTSFAAPYVTGVAALLMSEYPKDNDVAWNDYIQSIRNDILKSVDKVSSLEGKCVEAGRLNAYSALKYGDEYYIVRYRGGDFGSMEDMKVAFNEVTYLSENTLTYPGYEFQYWYAQRESDNKWMYYNTDTNVLGWYLEGQQPTAWEKYPYYDGDWILDLESELGAIVTFYAQWRECYRIQYLPNGGEGTMEDTVSYDEYRVALSACTFTKAGYDFGGWNAYYTSSEKWEYVIWEGDSYSEAVLYYEGEEPEGWHKKVRNDQSYFYTQDIPIGETVILYAVWYER